MNNDSLHACCGNLNNIYSISLIPWSMGGAATPCYVCMYMYLTCASSISDVTLGYNSAQASIGTRMGLDLVETCVCPRTRHNLTFQCTAVGTGNTIWRGSAFNCAESGHEIALQHSLFRYLEGAIAQCGNITGYSLGVENHFYTSQISVVFSSHLLGRTIECVYDNGEELVVIGNTTVSITTGTTV